MNALGAGRQSILIVDDEPFNIDLLRQELEGEGYTLLSAGRSEDALELCATHKPDLVLLDIMMPGCSGIELCKSLKANETTSDIPVIFMTALSSLDDKLEAFKAGGIDYVVKPFQAEEVLARVGTHLALRRAMHILADRNRQLEEERERNDRARQTIDYLKNEIQTGFPEIIGSSGSLRKVLEQLQRVAQTKATVLLQGETGTGKELFARAVHRNSAQRDAPMIKLNCAALPKELIESELFGHEEGAFTGAGKARKGRFELADGGTLFLDEISELPLEAQAKLLRVLQEQEFERIGGSKTIAVDVRIIAATNKDLRDAVDEGTFRSDLFYRLNVFPIRIPSLRERADDVVILANHFAEHFAAKLGRISACISAPMEKALKSYAWPGNIRELQNIIERAVILCDGSELELSEPLQTKKVRIEGTLEDVERTYIAQILDRVEGVIEGPSGAAVRLGMNPSTLRARMRKLQISKHQR